MLTFVSPVMQASQAIGRFAIANAAPVAKAAARDVLLVNVTLVSAGLLFYATGAAHQGVVKATRATRRGYAKTIRRLHAHLDPA